MEIEVFRKVYITTLSPSTYLGPALAICGDMVSRMPSGNYVSGEVSRNTDAIDLADGRRIESNQHWIFEMTARWDASVWIVNKGDLRVLHLHPMNWMPEEWMKYLTINNTITVRLCEDNTIWIGSQSEWPGIQIGTLKG